MIPHAREMSREDKSERSDKSETERSYKAPKEFEPVVAEPVGKDEVNANTIPVDNFLMLKNKRDSEDTQESLKERQMDEHTMDVSRRSQDNFKDLIWQLIYSRNLTEDADKVRAIFLWLVSKPLNTIEFPDYGPGTPEETLMNIKKGETTYSEVFSILCKYANIKCKVIHGYGKGAGFAPGMKLSGSTQVNHTWNAAMVDGRWHLFDCHWSARRIVGKDTTLDNIYYNVDDFYYMPDPNHLKMTHHPFEEKWQLTSSPLSLEEFEKAAPVKSSFFKHELTLVSHKHGYIDCPQPYLVIKIGFAAERLLTNAFTFSLRQEVLGEIYKTEDLSTYGMHEVICKSPPVEAFTFRFPRPGQYDVTIYVRDMSSETFSTACEYKVDVQFSQEGIHVPMPFPVTQQNGYGPTDVAHRLGIASFNDKSSVICGIEESVDIKFYCNLPNKKLPNMLAQLRGMGLNEEKLSQFVLQRYVCDSEEYDDKDILIITPFLPIAGEYALEIYAEDPNKDNSQYFLVWQFLLHSDKPHNYGPLPVLTGNVLGQLPQFRELHLATISHHDPLVRVPVVDVESESKQKYPGTDLSIDIRVPAPDSLTGFPKVRVIAQLSTMNEHGEEEHLSQNVLQQIDNNILTCLIRFPSAGLYKLHLYGHPLPDVDDTVPVVFTYLLHAPPRLSASALPYQGAFRGPYPKQSNKWKEGAVLHHPIDGNLSVKELYKNQEVKFSVLVPRAKDVAIMIDKEVHHLEGTPQSNSKISRWEGTVRVPLEVGKKIVVAGRWTTQQGNYPTLLEYTVVE